MNDLNMTERRRKILEVVQADRVRYDPRSAEYFVDNEAVGNWDRRTLSELRTAGMISPDRTDATSRVKITEQGAQHLVAS